MWCPWLHEQMTGTLASHGPQIDEVQVSSIFTLNARTGFWNIKYFLWIKKEWISLNSGRVVSDALYGVAYLELAPFDAVWLNGRWATFVYVIIRPFRNGWFIGWSASLSLQAMYGRMWKEYCEPALPIKQESDKILPVYFLSSLITPKQNRLIVYIVGC